jgi:hypothetical protein
MKRVHDETYNDYQIVIDAKYISDYYDWDEKYTNAVRFEYYVATPWKTDMYIESCQMATVVEKKPKRILFWKIQPKTTFEEDVREQLNWLIEDIKSIIDKRIYEKKMTDGLLDSLKVK